MEEEEIGMQLIDGNGNFNVQGLKDFTRNTQDHLSYAVVAIIGPQSSGKSTLMNHLFHTKFKELDAFQGRGQTTKGIWIAKWGDVIQPFTIAMDFEGTDSNQRDEDNSVFDKQSTLFALAIADIVLINMWYKDIGLEYAASRPLLKTVFQVMKRLFKPRKKTLLFVIRDHTKTPLKYLKTALMEDIETIWTAVVEHGIHGNNTLSDFFNVEITALSSYEYEEDKFKEQVAQLRQRLFHSISSDGCAGDRQEVEPTSGFCIRAEKIWKTIKDNKDLDLPALKVMVATVRCEEIAEEKLKRFSSDEGWLALKKAVQDGPVSGFGSTLSSILETYLAEYDMEVIYFDEDVRNAKRQQLESKALWVVHDTYVTMLEHLYSNTLETFISELDLALNEGQGLAASGHLCAQSCMLEFDKVCKDAAIRQGEWNALKVREKLSYAMFSEVMKKYENQLTDVLTEKVQSLLEAGETDTWASIRDFLDCKTEDVVSEVSNVVVSFKLHRSAIDAKLEHLREYARNAVKRRAREAASAGIVLMRMKDRFIQVFNLNENSKPRVWSKDENIDEIERNALSASLKILSIMASIRLSERPDEIENVLYSSLIDSNVVVPSSQHTSREASLDPLASNTWEEVSPSTTLLTPLQCKSLWMQFKADIDYTVTQARSTQESLRQADRAIRIVIGAVVVVGAAVIAAAGAPTAAAISTRREVAAVLKAVGPELAAVMKDLGPDVLVALKAVGPEVATAVKSLGPAVTIIVALMTNLLVQQQ